ncbi:hypothetical protein IWQ57_003229, partial [Coemansia nantahalensis]
LTFGQSEVIDALHQRLTAGAIRSILRAVLPEFAAPRAASDCDATARLIYMHTKLLNYMLLASKLRKGERNKVAVLQLAMGQCLRRVVDDRLVRTAQGARALVSACRRISEDSSPALRLSVFELYMLVLGAWKSGRHLLVPYLYQQACSQYRAGDETRFQRLSALVLAFYVREYAGSIGPAAIRGLLVDVNERLIRLSPHHYAMLILYFGKTGNLGEVLRVFEQAMDDPETRAAEATYYNVFRAFGCAFALQKRRAAGGAEAEAADGLDGDEDDDPYGHAAGADDEALVAADSDAAAAGAGRRLDRLQAARTCMRIFQGMTGSRVDVGFRTYRELVFCLFQFDMGDKARRVFEFAVANLPGEEIKAHLVAHYLRLAAPTPHERQLVLRGLLQQNEGLLAAVRSFSRRTLVDQFGIFDGDLAGFIAGAARPPATERGGAFQRRFLSRMHKARRAAAFVRCVLAGSDPTGEFKGYSFPALRPDASGLAAVEAEIGAACRHMRELSPAWLRHRDVIHALLPVLCAAPFGGEEGADPDGAGFIRNLVLECHDVDQFMARLDHARIEDYDVELVNHFLRVKYLGLTFRRYAEEKAAAAGGDRTRHLFWPSFMYSVSHAPLVLGDRSPLASVDRSAYARQVAGAVPAAKASWAQLTDMCGRDPHSRVSPNANTVSIFISVAGYAEDWAFGRRVWHDAARLMGRAGAPSTDGAPLLPGSPRPLERVRAYKCYLNLATQATQARSRELPFCEDALVDMFELMDRNGADVTSGLLCQAITAAFRVGQLDAAGALEQWQLHREQRGLAPPGFVQRYFAAQGLPEVPPELTSVLGLVRGAAGCPRLVGLISRRTRRRVG